MRVPGIGAKGRRALSALDARINYASSLIYGDWRGKCGPGRTLCAARWSAPNPTAASILAGHAGNVAFGAAAQLADQTRDDTKRLF